MRKTAACFRPSGFGIGWTINVRELLRRLGVVT